MRTFAEYYKSDHRNWTIDILRGVVIFIGAWGHFYFLMLNSGAEKLPWSHFSTVLLWNISYSLAVFAPVSGFLITSMLLKQTEGKLSNIHIPHFYLLRISRIMPGLILLCALNLLFYFLNYPGFQVTPFTWQILLTYIFTLRTNILFSGNIHDLWPWAILWTLAIEEVFYLLFPLICIALRSYKNIIFLLLIIIFYGPYCRFNASSAFASIRLYFGCFDLIAIGCLAALLAKTDLFFRYFKQFRPKIWISIGLFLMISVYFLTPWTYNNVWGPTAIGIGTFMYLLGVSYNQKNSPTLSANIGWKKFGRNLIFPICIMGILSYELYLFHAVVFVLFKPLVESIGSKIGWSWLFSNSCVCLLEGLTLMFGWWWFFHCVTPLRKKIESSFGQWNVIATRIQISRQPIIFTKKSDLS